MTEPDTGGPKTLADLLAKAEGGRRPRVEPSALRRHIRDNFHTIQEARGREVPWPTIAGAMAQLGVEAPGGGPPAWQTVKAMFYAERDQRGRDARGGKPRRKRGTARPRDARAGQAVAAAPAPSAPPAEEPPKPAPAGWMGRLAEVERQRAEAGAEDKPAVEHKPGMRG